MPKTVMQSTPARLVPDEGPFREIRLVSTNATSPEDFPGWVDVKLFDEAGVERATLMRVKMTNSGQRVAADFPGCDPAYVIVDGGGHITNG